MKYFRWLDSDNARVGIQYYRAVGNYYYGGLEIITPEGLDIYIP